MSARGVLDLSFNDLSSETDVATYLADRVKEEEIQNGAPLSPNKTKRRVSERKAVRLGNNNFTNLDVVATSLKGSVDPEVVHWIDLSFNQIEKIGDLLAKTFPNVQLLYLQANRISKLSDLRKLSAFKNLKSLVLFGNPIEESKHYRNMVLWACPQLQILDFCPITRQQRERNEIFKSTFRRRLYPDQDFD
jgi:Leucine-rich repeat (LRR) protein